MLTLPDEFRPALLPAGDTDALVWWFVFAGGDLLVRPTADGVELRDSFLHPLDARRQVLGGGGHHVGMGLMPAAIRVNPG